jgi:hypothetical protein
LGFLPVIFIQVKAPDGMLVCSYFDAQRPSHDFLKHRKGEHVVVRASTTNDSRGEFKMARTTTSMIFGICSARTKIPISTP